MSKIGIKMKSKNYSYNPLITEIIGICLLFLISRLLILFVLPIWYSDIPYYATIAEYASIANDRGLYLNDIKTFEYPPLAAFLLEIPNSFINENLISTSTYRSLYNYYFRLTIFLFDCIAFTFVPLSAFHLYPKIITQLYPQELPVLIKKQINGEQISRLVSDAIIERFIENLQFYFDNPVLVNEDVLELKIKELFRGIPGKVW